MTREERCAMVYEAISARVGTKEASAILWCATAYPAADAETTARQLEDALILLQLGRDPIAEADERIAEMMAQGPA